MNHPEKYSITRAIQCALAGREGNPMKKASGYELELHQELSRELPGSGATSFMIPLLAIAVKAQNVTTGTAGGFAVGNAVPQIAAALRPSSVCLSAGAQMIDLGPNAIVPRFSTGASAQWLAETEEAGESTAVLSSLALTPKRCVAWLAVSNQLLAQAPIADAVLTNDLRGAIGSALDLGLLSGVGGVEPLGLLNNDAVPSTAFAGAATRTKLAAMERALGDANANDLNAIFVTSPAAREKWRTAKSDATGIGFLWGDDNQALGRPARASNNITGDRAILGDFSDLLVVNWGVIEITDKFTKKKNAQTEILVQIMADGGPMRPLSFYKTSDTAAA